MSIFLLDLMLAFGLVLIGLMFINGIWHGKGTIIKNYFDIDTLFFPKLDDREIIRIGDRVAFLICIVAALLTFLNGLLCLLSPSVLNISGIFLFFIIIFIWPIRIVFIYYLIFKKRRTGKTQG